MVKPERGPDPAHRVLRYQLPTVEGGAGMDVHRLEVRDTQAKSPPILVAGGWATGPHSLDDLCAHLSDEMGATTSYFTHPRWGGVVSGEPEFPREELRKARMLITLAEHERSLESTRSGDRSYAGMRLVAHSEGAIYAMIAAVLRPDLFAQIVLYAPAGLQGPDSVTSLVIRYIQEMLQDTTDRPDMSELQSWVRRQVNTRLSVTPPHEVAQQKRRGTIILARHALANPVRSLREGMAIAGTDIFDLIGEVRSQGVQVGIIAPAHDVVMPDSRVQSGLTVHDIDAYLETIGKHNDIITQPGVATIAIREMFAAFDRRVSANGSRSTLV